LALEIRIVRRPAKDRRGPSFRERRLYRLYQAAIALEELKTQGTHFTQDDVVRSMRVHLD
jgi:hypothetical protein